MLAVSARHLPAKSGSVVMTDPIAHSPSIVEIPYMLDAYSKLTQYEGLLSHCQTLMW